MTPPQRIIGVDIGGTKIIAGTVDPTDGSVTNLVGAATPRAGGTALLDTVVDVVQRAHEDAPPGVTAIGVGTAGVVAGNAVVRANDLLPGWAEQPLVAQLMRATGGLPVTIRNDVHASALAEARIGAAASVRSALVVMVGTGIGGALVHDGRVLDGTHGIAGSVGHMPICGGPGALRCACGASGHAEAYAGGRAIEERWAAATGEFTTVRALATRIDEPAVRAHLIEAAELLGRAIAGACAVFDPQLVILGGGVAAIGPLFQRAVAAAVRDASMYADLAPRCVPAAMGNHAVLVGAALAAVEDEPAVKAGQVAGRAAGGNADGTPTPG